MQEQLANLIKEFKNPSLDYNPVIMWFWNSDIDEEGITFQLEKFREQNIIQFFIHSAAGMSVPYMSERYLELIKHVVKEAKRLGMKYWIYDEHDWPSGMVGGLLREKYPESQQKELYYQKETLTRHGMCVNVNRRGTFLCAQRITQKHGKYFVTDVTDLCEVTVDGECVNVQYQSRSLLEEEVLFCFSQLSDRVIYASLGRPGTKGVRGYINILREEYVAKFIEMTHEKYKEAIGEEFGKTVMGVFTDEPTSFYRFDGPHPGPWDDEFFAMFEEDHGYSLKPYMYALAYEPISPQEIKAREDYRNTVGSRYQRAFIQQVSKWCHDNNLILTGHFGGEEDLSGQVAQGDMQTEAMVLDIPGLDSIHSAHAIENYNFNVAGKLIAGAAKYKGADRVLCETYTISGWNLRFPVMRRIANRLLTLGANMIQYMGAAYSLYGGRKSSGGPPHSYMNPMFQHYRVFNKYVAGISAISAATRPDAGVLVFNPLKQMIQKYQYLDVRHRSDCIKVQRIYEDTVNALLWEGISFDLFSEDLADQITVKDGFVMAFGYRYECIVFPDMYFVNSKTGALLKALKQYGVKTIFVHELPTCVVDTEQKTGLVFEGNAVDMYTEEPLNADSRIICTESDGEILADGQMYLMYPTNWPVTLEKYRQMLRSIIGRVSLNMKSEGRVYIGERSNNYCKAYFICNDENRRVRTFIDVVPGMHIFNSFTCEEMIYPQKDGRAELTLEAYEMLVILCDKQAKAVSGGTEVDESADIPEGTGTSNSSETDVYRLKKEITLGNRMEFHAEGGNCLPVYWEMFDKETGTWESCKGHFYPPDIRLKTLEDYRLRTQVELEYVPEKIYLNAEIYGVTGFRINGTEVSLSVNTRRFSEWDCCVEVTSLLHEGINLMELDGTAELAYSLAMPPFVFLSGAFRVSDRGTVIEPCSTIEMGGWEQQGYPRFYGNAVYAAQIQVCDSFRKAVLEIACEDPVEVYVNGKKAGLIIWKPRTVDITELLSTGENRIELRITSTLNNIFDRTLSAGLLDEAVLHLFG